MLFSFELFNPSKAERRVRPAVSSNGNHNDFLESSGTKNAQVPCRNSKATGAFNRLKHSNSGGISNDDIRSQSESARDRKWWLDRGGHHSCPCDHRAVLLGRLVDQHGKQYVDSACGDDRSWRRRHAAAACNAYEPDHTGSGSGG
jgi:hypothetical protein